MPEITDRPVDRADRHHHELTEIINAATPSSTELPASIMTSGISGHEHVEPEYEVEIPRRPSRPS